MKRLLTALATAGLLAGVFGFAAPHVAKAGAYDTTIWVSMKGTPEVDVNNLEYDQHSSSMGIGPYRANYSRDGYDCMHPDYNDIQLAVDNSNDNDTIYICPGLWNVQESWVVPYGMYWHAAVVTDNPVSGDDTTGLHFVGAGAKKTIIEGLVAGNKLDVAFDVFGYDNGPRDASFTALTIQDFKYRAVYGDDITCDRVTFKNNGIHLMGDLEPEEWNGGAILTEGDLESSNCVFTNNQGDEGGAIYVSGYWIDHGSIFTGNFGGDNGGAAYVEEAVDLNGTVFLRNSAEEDEGGALYVGGNDTMWFDHVTAIGNKALNSDGGAIYIDDDDQSVYVTSSTFKNNVADGYGGAIMAYDDAILTITGSIFQGNRSGDSGGAIYAYQIDVTGNRFVGNVSGGCGGAFLWVDDVYNGASNTYRGNRDSDGVSTYCED